METPSSGSELLLKKVELPEEYAKGLEDLLLKEQEDDRTSVDAEIEQKKVAIAQSQAEAAKAPRGEARRGRRASAGDHGYGAIRRHAVHIAAEAEAD